MGRFLLFFTLAALPGCGALLDFDPPDPQAVDGGASDMGSNIGDAAVMDAHVIDATVTDGGVVDATRPDGGPPPCRLDAQCDDHVFCDGIEVCVGGTCHSGGPPPCTPVGAPDCVVGSCDATVDDCVLSADDTLCAGGEICDRVEGCRAPPTCVHDTDCMHDACHTATCSAGSCVVVANAPCVDTGMPDCLVPFCHPVLGCTTAPSASFCDDHIPCTTDVCNPDGSCGNHLNDTFCDFDGASCTLDRCAPTDPCADTSTGCLSTLDDTVCPAWLATLSFTDPPPACFTAICLPGSTAMIDRATGCAVEPVCSTPGTTCVATAGTPVDAGAAVVCGATVGPGCSTSVECDDGNPCNGAETCAGTCHVGSPPCGTALGTICTLRPSGGFDCSIPATSICTGG